LGSNISNWFKMFRDLGRSSEVLVRAQPERFRFTDYRRVAQGADLHPVLKEMGIPRRQNPGWITEPDIPEALLHRNGFTNINVQMDSMDFRYSDAEDVWQTARGTGMRRVLDRLDAMQKERALSLFTERMKPHQRHDGYYLRATALLAVTKG
jgi:hypothetical protein